MYVCEYNVKLESAKLHSIPVPQYSTTVVTVRSIIFFVPLTVHERGGLMVDVVIT